MIRRVYLALLTGAFFLLMGCKQQEAKRITEANVFQQRIGVMLGTTCDQFMIKHHPQSDLYRMDSYPDQILALNQRKVDVVLMDESAYNITLAKTGKYSIVIPRLYVERFGMGFSKKNSTLREAYNRFLEKIKADGTYDRMVQKWNDSIETASVAIDPNLKGEPLRVACTGATDFFEFFRNGQLQGFDIDMVQHFAAFLGRPVEFSCMNFSSLIPALVSQKVDLITACIAVTEERKKQIDFSDVYYESRMQVLALKENTVEGGGTASVDQSESGFLQSVIDSFRNNILAEKRYELILDGLLQTLIISLFSILLGTVLGGGVCALRMSSRWWMQQMAKIYIDLMRGIPLLVFLMISFYVVFASSNISATLVAIIAFAMSFAAYTSEMFRTSIEGVDKGQREAGIAMGFTKWQTFVFFVFPQALQKVIPVYKGEAVSMLKSTSIVGYIAIQDLTKASDIIRSRTFDAFFPLIMVAIIYFVLSWLLGLLLDYFHSKLTKVQ